MKRNVVFLYSGQARSFGKPFKDRSGGEFSVWKSQFWQVVRHFPEAKCYAAISNDEDVNDMKHLKEMFTTGDVTVLPFNQPDLPEREQFKTVAQGATPYRISAPIQSILRQMWWYKQVWDMYEPLSDTDDIVIRMRPDLFFKSFYYFPIEAIARTDAYSPFWGSYGGMNDRFGIFGFHAAMAYFNSLCKIDGMLSDGCPFHPETMQAYALECSGCVLHRTLATEFSTIRKDGTEVQSVHLPIDEYIYNEG